jgi:hypothetical protein
MIVSEDPNFADAIWIPFATSRNFILSEDNGERPVYAKFRDTEALTSETKSDTITLDTIGPTGTVSFQEGDPTTSESVTLNLTADDNGGTGVVLMRIGDSSSLSVLDWEPFQTTKPWTLSSGDGTKTIYVQFRDRAGNESTVISGSINLWTSIFGPGQDISSDAHETTVIAVGDLDGDGDLDVVTAGYWGNPIRLYLNNGTSHPFDGVTGSDISTDKFRVTSLALGDLDGDGDLDLVTGNADQGYGGWENRLYLNNGTSNPFQGVTGVNITSDRDFTLSVALGDLDGDGDLDFVAGNLWGTNRLYLNNGTPDPFSGVTGLDLTTDTHSPRSISIGDLDRDGDLDVIAGNYSPHPGRIYFNNGTSNPFNGVTGLDFGSDTGTKRSVNLGDVDGDGDLDIACGIGDGSPGHNYLYLNNGTGVFGVGKKITEDFRVSKGAFFGDVDGDGDLDIVVGNAVKPSRYYLNNGTSDPFNGVSGKDFGSGDPTNSIALGDMDGDGDLDVVTGNYQAPHRLYLNNSLHEPFTGFTGKDLPSDFHRTYSIALGDIDGDGDLDVVDGTNAGKLNQLYLNNGTSDPFNGVKEKGIGEDELLTWDANDTYSVALGDMDGDGDLDLVAGNFRGTNRLYLNNGTLDPFNGVSGKDITSDDFPTIAIALGDFDKDGDLDVVSAGNSAPSYSIQFYQNNGTSDPFNGITRKDITNDRSIESMAVGDVDGDGDLDLVTGTATINQVFLNNGTSDPFNGVIGKDISTDSQDSISIALGDVDKDGDLDLVVGNKTGGSDYSKQINKLYLNNGTPDPFGGVVGKDISSDSDLTSSVALGDVDGDGDLDLVTGVRKSFPSGKMSINRLYLNNGTADPFNGVTGQNIASDDHDTRSVALGDLDGDGDLDIVAGNYGNVENIASRLYLNNMK